MCGVRCVGLQGVWVCEVCGFVRCVGWWGVVWHGSWSVRMKQEAGEGTDLSSGLGVTYLLMYGSLEAGVTEYLT